MATGAGKIPEESMWMGLNIVLWGCGFLRETNICKVRQAALCMGMVQAVMGNKWTLRTRIVHGLRGMFFGDALAMPTHWYYNRRALERDYGRVESMVSPKPFHPDSILWRSQWKPTHPECDILHGQAPFWGQPGIHYHQDLQAGENTLNLQLAQLTIRFLTQNREWNREAYEREYIRFMTVPGNHHDTYIEECHRHFFGQLGKGFPPHQCAAIDEHIGGIAGLAAIYFCVLWLSNPAEARQAAAEWLHVTHRGPSIDEAASIVMDLFEAVLIHGQSLTEAMDQMHQSQRYKLLGFPLKSWLLKSPQDVIGKMVSPACYLKDAVPATLYLARKFAHNPVEALIENTMAGGDNCHRGAVLGALLGCSSPSDPWPKNWSASGISQVDGFFDAN